MKNDYEIRGEVTAIILKSTNGDIHETLIDTCDLEKAKAFPYTWYPKYEPLIKSLYARGSLYLGMNPYAKGRGIQKMTHLHRWVFDEEQDGKVVDHINHDTLDNRRSCNLRWVTHAQNQANGSKVYKNSKSGIKGVTWVEKTGSWQVRIRQDGKMRSCGYFRDLQDAIDHSRKVFEERMITHGY